VALLTAAIDKAVLGYHPQADAPVTDFWRRYWLTTLRLAPELEMREPDAKPGGAGFIYFWPAALPRGIELCHKLHHGHVDLQFNGWGTRVQSLRGIVAAHLHPGMQLGRANKSAAIRVETPVLNTGQPFVDQEGAVIVGIQSARSLLQWYESHRAVLEPLARGPLHYDT
jgi:hypothetical protein